MEQYKVPTLAIPMVLPSNYCLPSAAGIPTTSVVNFKTTEGVPKTGFGNYNMPHVSIPILPSGYNQVVLARKLRRERTVFSQQQIDVLEALFSQSKYLDCESRHRIAQEIRLDKRRVQTWFKNRRAKNRQQEKFEREMAEFKRKLIDQRAESAPPTNFVTAIPNKQVTVKIEPAAPVEAPQPEPTIQSPDSIIRQVRSEYQYTEDAPTPTFEPYPMSTYFKTSPDRGS